MNEQKIHNGHSFSHFFNDLSILVRIHTYSRLFSDFHDDIEKFHDFSMIKLKNQDSMIFPGKSLFP